MNSVYFSNPDQSHQHSLRTLNALYEYDDFMMSIRTLIDMGCGSGQDLEWWATRTTRDEDSRPLNIKCTGTDLASELTLAHRYRNMQYQPWDFETSPTVFNKKKFDIVWCHDAFQYVINPFTTLSNWYDLMAPGGMMVLILPQNTNVEFNVQLFDQHDYVYHNWTMVSLIHILALSGFDCKGGFFLKEPNDPWLHAVVYKSQIKPLDPRTTRWYDLADKDLLPVTAVDSIQRHGYLRQQDLVLPWLDRSLRTLVNQ